MSGELDDTHPHIVRRLPVTIPYVECQNWQRGVGRSAVDLVVLHDMESPELVDSAEGCAAWVAGHHAPKYPAPMASAHYFVDCDSVVQGVRENCVAWHAPGANRNGIGIEHAGQARQSEFEWLDAYGQSMLTLSAELCAGICDRWKIPLAVVDVAGLLVGNRGITLHRYVSQAFKKSDHDDPGPNFPLDWYMRRVRAYADLPAAPLLRS